MLEMALAHANVKITHLQIWDVPTHLSCQGLTTIGGGPRQPALSTWVDVDGLDAHNSEEKIASRGFTLGPGRNRWGPTTGGCVSQSLRRRRSSGLKLFLLSQVFTGRSYPKVDPSGKNIVPPGYDFPYVRQRLSASRPAADYSHEYIVRDLSQVLPQFVAVLHCRRHDLRRPCTQCKGERAHHSAHGTDVMGDILICPTESFTGPRNLCAIVPRHRRLAVRAIPSERSTALWMHRISQMRGSRLAASCSLNVAVSSTTSLLRCRTIPNLLRSRSTPCSRMLCFLCRMRPSASSTCCLARSSKSADVSPILIGLRTVARFRAELGPRFVHAWHHCTVRKSLYKYRDIGSSILDRAR